MPGQKRDVLEWPYREGLRIDEAMHPLAIFATGMYGGDLANQNGAPLRLVVPWKYGFKSIKSIVKVRLVEQLPVHDVGRVGARRVRLLRQREPGRRPPALESAQASAASATSRKRPTLPFNGYARRGGVALRGHGSAEELLSDATPRTRPHDRRRVSRARRVARVARRERRPRREPDRDRRARRPATGRCACCSRRSR